MQHFGDTKLDHLTVTVLLERHGYPCIGKQGKSEALAREGHSKVNGNSLNRLWSLGPISKTFPLLSICLSLFSGRKGCGQRGGLTSSPLLGLTHTLFSHPPGLPSASSAGQLCTQEQLGPGAKPQGGHRRCPWVASGVGSWSLPRPGDVPSGTARVTTRETFISKL